MEEKGPWRGSRRDKSPEFPEPGLQKESLENRRGFDIFSRRVGPGTWYPHKAFILSENLSDYGISRPRGT